MTTQNAFGRLDKTQTLAVGATQINSQPVGPQTFKVRLASTVACLITTNNAVGAYLPADSPEYFSIHPGEKVGVQQVSAAGTLTLSEITA